MCGISGFWNRSQHRSLDEIQLFVQRMSDTLAHRRLNDGGVWVDAESLAEQPKIGFGIPLEHWLRAPLHA